MRAPLSALAVLIAAASAHAAPLRCTEDGEGGACIWGKVEGYDGASLQIRGLTIAVAGIAVPHRRDLCQDKTAKTTFDCARPARRRMAELLAKGVACDIVDVAGGQVWGRCTVNEGDLGRALVASGVARAAKDGPYDPDQSAALAAKKGLWAPDMVIPKEWEAIRKKGD